MRKICMYQDLYVPIWSALQNTVNEKEKKRGRKQCIYSMLHLLYEKRTHIHVHLIFERKNTGVIDQKLTKMVTYGEYERNRAEGWR